MVLPRSTGQVFSNEKFTAASNTLSLNTYVKVTNLANGKYLYVRINDRMAKNNKRLIDMASICAKKLDYHNKGLAKVKVEIVPEEEGRNGILAQRTELNTEKANNINMYFIEYILVIGCKCTFFFRTCAYRNVNISLSCLCKLVFFH